MMRKRVAGLIDCPPQQPYQRLPLLGGEGEGVAVAQCAAGGGSC